MKQNFCDSVICLHYSMSQMSKSSGGFLYIKLRLMLEILILHVSLTFLGGKLKEISNTIPR